MSEVWILYKKKTRKISPTTINCSSDN